MADEKKTVVEEAKARYERAKSAYSSSRAKAIEDTKFALGDSDNGWQWPEEIRNARKQDKKVCLTVNITAQHCNQIINNMRQNSPQARVLPVDSHADKKTAEIIGGLIRNIQTTSNAETAHMLAAEHCVYGGEGYWRIITEYESEKSFNQNIRIKAIANPQSVYIDPAATEPDKSDAEWGFVFEDISTEQCKREHPDIDPASWSEDSNGWASDETVRRAEYFYCEYEKDTLYLINNGTEEGATLLKSEIPPEQLAAIKPMIVSERPTTIKKWKWCKLLGGHDEPIDMRDWPGSYLPIIAAIGKEVNVNGEIVVKGIVRDLKDTARMVNFSYSETIQTVALQNKIPYMASVEATRGLEEYWDAPNLNDLSYLPFNEFNESGERISRPERQPGATMATAQVQLLQLSTDQMRAASGQQNANFGIRSEAVSGVGIQRLKAQGENATFHFPDNHVRALRYEALVLLDLIPKVYDTKRVVRILGLDGKDEKATLDPGSESPYAENTVAEDVEKIFNPLLGKYDVVIDTGPSYQTQRQESAAILTDLAAKNPQIMGAAGDIVMRSYDFPMAEELAKRLEKTLPPGMKEDAQQPQIPPQVQQQMQQDQQQSEQMKQHIQMLEQSLQEIGGKYNELEQSRQIEAGKLEVDRMNAETARMKAQGELQIKAQASQPTNELPEIEKLRFEADVKIRLKQMEIDAAKEIEIMRHCQKVDMHDIQQPEIPQ